MTSPQTTLLKILLCVGIGSLSATTGDHTSALNPNDPTKVTLPASQDVDAFKGKLIETPASGEIRKKGLAEAPPQDIFDALFENHDKVPKLAPLKPSEKALRKINEPLHTKIKSIPYSQYITASSGGSEEPDSAGSTGYEALNSGLLSVELPHASEAQMAEIINKMHDRSVCEELFAHESSTWRSTIITKRRTTTLFIYLLKTYIEHLSFNLEERFTDGAAKPSDTQADEVNYLILLFSLAARKIAHAHGQKEGFFTITPQELSKALEQEAAPLKSETGRHFEHRLIDTYLPILPTVSGELKQGKNHNAIVIDRKTVFTQNYAPKGADETLDGSWLSLEELKDLANKELENPTRHLTNLQGKNIPVHFLEFTQQSSLKEHLSLNRKELDWLRTELKKKSEGFTTLFMISFEKEWTSCLITQSAQGVQLTITDPHNKDRSVEKGMISLAQAIEDGLSTKKAQEEKKVDTAQPKKRADGLPSDVNYAAPLALLTDDELPTLEDFFGNKIPNEIMVCIKQLKKEPSKGSVGEKLKNGFMLYGPPGTGKSTIAQVMARMAGRSIIYAGGGDFRDAYQGSGKAKLDALFAEAKKRGNCIILIDEIDGTTNKLQPHNSTQEDNRAVKSLITTLDQYRHDPDIFVICTTNYPENIDPAIMRRFKRLEIPLPAYQQRKKIINYYLKQNKVQVKTRTPHALSPDFYNKLISATEGFSGDTLGEMINSAVYEYQEGLIPESRINLDFRTKGVDFSNKSLLANLGEIALLPFIPLFMMIGESDLDKHVYSHYKRQLKVIADLQENERKNDPQDRFAKEPLFTRIFKRNFDLAGTATERGFWDMLIRHGWNKTFKAMGINMNS